MEKTWMSYQSDDRMIVFDARFELQHPAELDHLYIVEAPMADEGLYGYGTDGEVARFAPLEDALDTTATAAGLVGVGRRRGFGKWELAWYGRDGAQRPLQKTLRAEPQARLLISEDSAWAHYHDKLLPRGKDRHRAHNGLVVWQLLQAGDALDAPRPIEFFVYFSREIDRERYLRDIGSTGLDAEPIEDDGPGIRAYFTAPVDVELITDITWELHERAVAGNGVFDGWRCSPVLST